MSAQQNSLREVAVALADLFSRVPRTVLADTLRTADQRELKTAIEEELAKKNNLVEVNIVSSRPLSEKIKAEVDQWVKKAQQPRQVNFFYEVDASLLGGIIIRTPTQEIDLSVRNQINNLTSHA